MGGQKAASLKDQNFSMNGEPSLQEEKYAESQSALNAAPTVPEVAYRVFKLSDTNRRGRYHMDGTDDVWNPTTKRMERIRLLRGHTSIVQAEQKDVDATYVTSNKRSLIFIDGALRIPIYDTTALEFLERSNACLDNPHRKATKALTFFEWNPVRIAEEQRAKRSLKVQAIKLASLASDDSMRKHANYLGISFTDQMGFPKTNDALRNDYELYAEAQPKRFIESANSKEVEVAYVVKRAILDGKIDLTGKMGSAYWASDGGYICKIPSDQDAQSYLVEYAMLPNPDSKQFLEQLKNLE